MVSQNWTLSRPKTDTQRGKVLRTILALFNASTSPQELGDSVWDWWSMVSPLSTRTEY